MLNGIHASWRLRPAGDVEIALAGSEAAVVASVEIDGLSHREMADRLKVSAASVSRWRTLACQKGEAFPGPLGGDRKTDVIEAPADTILKLFQGRRDMSLEE